VFQLFQTYVTSVSFGCYKSRSGIVHVAMCMKKRRGRERSPCNLAAWAGACWRGRGREVQARVSRHPDASDPEQRACGSVQARVYDGQIPLKRLTRCCEDLHNDEG
jgi:hypothetical protein